MKKLFLLLIPFLLAGCAILYPQPKQVLPQDQQDFCQAFSEFQESHRIAGFKKLVADFPESLWSARAKTIILYTQDLDQLKVQNEQLHRSQRQHSLDLESLSRQNQQLKEQSEQLDKLNRQLTDKIEQLKDLLIQSEKYPQK
ncbi:MAG: hypothetical protein KAG93_05310 [Desulfuromusa sp.]|nr:hypothetical protein [Desulfuromusa sp.]